MSLSSFVLWAEDCRWLHAVIRVVFAALIVALIAGMVLDQSEPTGEPDGSEAPSLTRKGYP